MERKAALSVNDEIELKITNIAHGGISVARHDGRVVFVSDAIPGETVLAKVTETRRKSFARATTVRVLEASPHRVAHVWDEASIDRDPADRVGGAEFGHIALAHQRVLKEEVLQDAMKRFGRLDVTATVVPAPGDDEVNGLGWRTRVRLHVDAKSGAVGQFAARSNRVIPVSSLPLACEAINQISPLHEYMSDIEYVDVVAPSGDYPRSLLKARDSDTRAGEADPVREVIGDQEFFVSAGGFWQVHREAPSVLYKAVQDALESVSNVFEAKAPNLDLYGGVGIFAKAMLDFSGKTTKVTSVEAASTATDFAAENLADYIGALTVTDRVDRYLSKLNSLANATVILDPPRSGAGLDVTQKLVSLQPKNLIYVACDPVALARDTAALTEQGYALTSLRAFDLFPHTHHFECVAVFQK